MKRIAAKNIILLVFSVAFLIVLVFAAANYLNLQQFPQPGFAEKYALPVTAIILFLLTIAFLFENNKNKQQFSQQLNYQTSLIDTIFDAIFSIDKNLCIQSWNKYAAEFYGIPVTEATGKQLDTLIKIDMSDEQKNDQFQHLLLNNSFRAEYLVTKRDGQQVYIMASISTMRNKQGNITGYVAVHRDITERRALEEQLRTVNKQLETQVNLKTTELTETIARGLGFAISEKDAEQALIASKQKYQLLFYNNPMPMWMLSQPEKNFVDVNEAALIQYGFSREEFLKMNIADLRPWDEPEMIMGSSGTLAKSESFSKVWRYKKKNGEIVKVEILENELFYEGKNVQLILANNIDEKVKAEEKLQHSYAQIRQLANHLQKIREQERTHIAREIHDELGQQLTGLKMYVSWLSKKNISPEPAIKTKFLNTMELIEDTIKSVRKISTELRPSMLDDLGLLAAMEWQSNEFGKRYGINAVFINLTGNKPIPARFSTGLFRIFQESLTNVARHAEAKKVVSSLLFNNTELVLTIEDDGKGFIVKNIGSKKTLGLFGMKERTMEMGGTYEIKSEPGTGTTVSVKIRIH